MNEMHEEVELPDLSEKALLHPTDIAQARSLYVRGWWFGRLKTAPVAVALGAVVWLFSGNLLATILAPATCFAIGFVAGRWYIARAWDFIPRKRQRSTDITSWKLGAAWIDGVALVIATIALVLAAQANAIPLAVIAYSIGAAIAVGLVQGIELVILATRTTTRREAPPKVVMMGAVAASCLAAALMGIGTDWYQHLVWVALLGAGIVLLAQALWWVFDFSRRPEQAVTEKP